MSMLTGSVVVKKHKLFGHFLKCYSHGSHHGLWIGIDVCSCGPDAQLYDLTGERMLDGPSSKEVGLHQLQ